jgi:hypothetical protein
MEGPIPSEMGLLTQLSKAGSFGESCQRIRSGRIVQRVQVGLLLDLLVWIVVHNWDVVKSRAVVFSESKDMNPTNLVFYTALKEASAVADVAGGHLGAGNQHQRQD